MDKIRILGSSFTEDEYQLYGFDRLEDPADAMRYLSHRQNHEIYRPAVNRGYQQHLLEDKWVSQLFLNALGIPVPKTYGLFHPRFGITPDGSPMRTPEHVASTLERHLPSRFVLKPRGGRQGHNIIVVKLRRGVDGSIQTEHDGQSMPLTTFLANLPNDAFGDYGGCYHGWLVQDYLQQHDFLGHINPHTVNSLRVVTFIDTNDEIRIPHAVLRLGREGSAADNWDKGGLSVAVDQNTGTLGRGVFKIRYGGDWVSEHPDTSVHFEGQQIPNWNSILDICKRAAATMSGVRAIGWDVALTPSGPVIIEGNSTWGLPVLQVHTKGFLTDETRRELELLGARFPDRPRPLPAALVALLVYQWRRSRGPRLMAALRERIGSTFHLV
ncbi:sugar-transfer associated ATP-grasp domain-containing protein [Ectothiorhodospira variabilis]|uniref:sugar-transfer associated ATP-grasp domain-containing protein n=1 Tax=Ectothiorhodospira variabilis TaxID=505694 RepID=UPI0023787E21|nr:sugar-transfer associated ATP-grasp domain-containing protein [Ectothiorhodospira variabilis]